MIFCECLYDSILENKDQQFLLKKQNVGLDFRSELHRSCIDTWGTNKTILVTLSCSFLRFGPLCTLSEREKHFCSVHQGWLWKFVTTWDIYRTVIFTKSRRMNIVLQNKIKRSNNITSQGLGLREIEALNGVK